MASSHRRKKPTARQTHSDENFVGVYRRYTFSGAEAIQRVKRLWGDTLDKNLAAADILLNLPHGYVTKGNYHEHGLPFEYCWFRKMIKIGKHPDINDPEYHDKLPNARRTLYQIALLKHDLFLDALHEIPIHPHVTAKEVEIWRNQQRGIQSAFRVKLTITAANKLADILSGLKPALNEEMVWESIANLRMAVELADGYVSVDEIISSARSEARGGAMRATKNLTPAEVRELAQNCTDQTQRPGSLAHSPWIKWHSWDRPTSSDSINGPLYLPMLKPNRR